MDWSVFGQYGALGTMTVACLLAISWLTRRVIGFMEGLIQQSATERGRFLDLLAKYGDSIDSIQGQLKQHQLDMVTVTTRNRELLTEMVTLLRHLNGRPG